MNDLQFILQDFYIDKQHLYNYNDEAFNKKIENINESAFKFSLSDYLYKNYYCGLIHHKDSDGANKEDKHKILLDKLTNAVGDYDLSFDYDWKIEEKDHSGNVYVQKGYLRNIVSAGQYLSNQFSIHGDGANSEIQKAKVPYKYNTGDYFIFFYGNTPSESKGNFLVRFYFNTEAEHVPSLINYLIKYLNKLQVPFEMKCPVNPSSYNRQDTVVLYLNKRYTNYFLTILSPMYQKIQDLLNASIPLFTKKIYPGIGFAESPPENNTSFGMSRCDLITQGIYSSIISKLPKNKWYINICEELASKNFDIDRFYLNPINNYPYDFAQTATRNN